MYKTFLLFLFISFGCYKKEKAAIVNYEKIVSHRNKGLAYLEEENFTEAEKQFKLLTILAPQDPLGFSNLGLTYLKSDGQLQKSKQWIQKALDLNQKHPEIRMLLTLYYELNNQDSLAFNMLKKTIEYSPNHVKTLYKLTEYYLKKNDLNSKNIAQLYLKNIIEIIPANIIVQLDLIETLLNENKISEALKGLNKISQIFPKLSENSMQMLNNSIRYLNIKDLDQAKTYVMIFENLIRPTSFYKSSLIELKGNAGPVSGSPLLRFTNIDPIKEYNISNDIVISFKKSGSNDFKIINDNAKSNFKDKVTLIFSTGDIDLDGDTDLFISQSNVKKNITKQFIFSNENGKYIKKTIESKIVHSSNDIYSKFSDYNNDGYLDLFIINANENMIYKNLGNEKFELSNSLDFSNFKSKRGVFMDFDIEGDLDLILFDDKTIEVFQNTSEGTFKKIKKNIGLDNSGLGKKLITHADFNDDGDNDIIIVKYNGKCDYYENMRGGNFQLIEKNIGLNHFNSPGSVITGDYNNDGYIDLFISDLEKENHFLYENMGDAFFRLDKNWEILKKEIPKVSGIDSKFLDFDNDGYLDLLIAGELSQKESNKSGLVLLHNQMGYFEDASHILPNKLGSVHQVEVFDYDTDGDLDMLIALTDGKIELLENSGGNLNNYVNIQLLGLRTGSGKNNYFGIGSKIELRAGSLYQTRYVDSPIAHFGLGNVDSVDVVRVLWSNGVPQNHIKPEQNQTIVEKQILKGSCPYLFLWNGSKYEFGTDVLWPSALGMPLGIMAGEPLYAFPNSTDEYIKIPSNILKPQKNKYTLQFTTELWETPYLDKVELLVVDHPKETNIYIDETFMPPPFKPLKIYNVQNKYLPKKAVDGFGDNILEKIIKSDKIYLSNITSDQYQGVTKFHDLVLTFNDLNINDSLSLFLQGWLFPTDASINVRLSQSENIKSIFPYLQVPDENGDWKTVIENIGFPKGKNKTMIIDMTDKFISADYRLRIRTNMQIYWDHIFIANTQLKTALKPIRLSPISADLHYRGFSKITQENFSSPHLPDYYTTTKEQRWRDLIGNYTKYGDVASLLIDSDNKYVIMNSGDEVTLQFEAKNIPSLKNGWARDFIFFNDGWLKDGDLNTASGKTVKPLPFHSMKSYPKGAEDGYPKSKEFDEYRKLYNTRSITKETFKNRIKGK
jgi:hypothetical protein